MIELSGIDPDKKVNEITKEERLKFVRLIKAFPLTLNGLRDFNEAIITKGGVKVSEVNPSTMADAGLFGPCHLAHHHDHHSAGGLVALSRKHSFCEI